MKLLVTTDFSANSKGAIRFAQSIAKQTEKVEVTFYHSIYIMQPTRWSNAFFVVYKDEEIKRLTKELEKFIYSTIGKDNSDFSNIKFVVSDSLSTEKDIVRYAESNNMDFICIATQGAGLLRQILGTHTSYVVNHSTVPVLVIPSHYRTKPLKKATYLSDFENLNSELLQISKLSTPINLQIEVLHYSSTANVKRKYEESMEVFKTKEFENFNLMIQDKDLKLPLVDRVTKYIRKSKPELLIMFTHRKKGFFENLFSPSKSTELTYTTRVPVLIFSK